jgi:hypothetical protein
VSQQPERRGGLSRDDVFRVLGALGAILTLVTAVLFYFGWRRSETQSRVMGIDVSLFGFTSQDYVLRSISSLYLPLLVLAGLGLLWVRLHARASAWLSRRAEGPAGTNVALVRGARATSLVAGVIGAACLVFTVVAGWSEPPAWLGWLVRQLSRAEWVVPLALLACVVVVAYCGWARRVLAPQSVPRSAPWVSVLSGAFAAVIVILSAFWILEEYAAAVGRGYAQQLVSDVGQLPRATVTSPAPLDIQAPGVTQAEVDDHGVTIYRTTGLRLLARSGSKILLVHDGWQPRSGAVVVLPDSDAYSWQFSR